MQRGAPPATGISQICHAVARLLFGGEENVLAVKGDGGIGGGREGRRDGALAAGCHQLERGAGGKALAAIEHGGGIVAGGFCIDVGDGYHCLGA